MPVYFIQAGQNGPIKIGSSKCPSTRLATLQTAHHVELRLLGEIHYQDGRDAHYEKRIHEWLSTSRLRGEWFRPDMLVLRFIAVNCGDEAPE